jgi:hypothetical protein
MHAAVRATGDWLGCFEQHTAKFLNFDTLSRGWVCLQAAEQAVQDDPERRFRVQVAQLPVMYVFMMRWDEMFQAAETAGAEWPMPSSRRATHERFMEIARRKHITRLDEWHEGFGALDRALGNDRQ